ncbi:MAG: hypothetical protein K0U37_01575 [Gammaproteobacteria bacterium]|nr:hypothetical protein [Gammaproteobacteria bacterium]
MLIYSKKAFFCLMLGFLGAINVFAAPEDILENRLTQSESTQPRVSNIFTPYITNPDLLGAAGKITLTGTGTIRFLQAFFYSDVACSTILGIASVIDNSLGFSFTDGQTVSLNDEVAFTLADNQEITTGDIACMKLFWNGSNESPDGVNCQSFTDMSCSGSKCTSSQTKTATWEADPTACEQRYAYITDFSANTVTQCAVHAVTGLLSGCTTTGSGFSGAAGVQLNNGYAYISNFSSSEVRQCAVNTTDGTLPVFGCASTALSITPLGLALNNGYAYFSNNSTTVTKCTVSASDGTLSSCGTVVSGLSGTRSVSVNNGYIYITRNGPGELTKCTVSVVDGTLSSCGTTGLGFSDQRGLAINNGYAYVVNRTPNTVSKCTISAVDGTLSSCGITAIGFSTPIGITISNNFAYITNDGTNDVTKCTVDSVTGDLSSCGASGAGTGFTRPFAIAIY